MGPGTRRAIMLALGVLGLGAVTLASGHRCEHAVQNLLLPGAGLAEHGWWLAAAVFAVFVVALAAWLQWGADWLPATVVVASTVAAFAFAPTEDPAAVALAAHQFPVIAVVVSALAGLGTVRRSLRPIRRSGRTTTLSARDRLHLTLLTGLLERIGPVDGQLIQRARRIDLVARGRRRRTPDVDHGPLRTALALVDGAGRDDLIAEATTAPGGVPGSEPGWVRLLDGTLTAIHLDGLGDERALDRWDAMLAGPFSDRRGHRPTQWWTPLSLRIGKAPAWEHAAATALATAAGCRHARDWPELRARALAATTRTKPRPEHLRLIAAGRIWAVLEADEQAAKVLARRRIDADPIAVALDAVALDILERGVAQAQSDAGADSTAWTRATTRSPAAATSSPEPSRRTRLASSM